MAAEASTARSTPASASRARTGSSRSADHPGGTRRCACGATRASASSPAADRCDSISISFAFAHAKKSPARGGAFWPERLSGGRGLLRLLRMLLHRMMRSLLVLAGLVGLHRRGLGLGLRGSRGGGDRDDGAGNQERAEDGGEELLEHRHLQN